MPKMRLVTIEKFQKDPTEGIMKQVRDYACAILLAPVRVGEIFAYAYDKQDGKVTKMSRGSKVESIQALPNGDFVIKTEGSFYNIRPHAATGEATQTSVS